MPQAVLPPKWNEVTASPEWQKATPEMRDRVRTNWMTMARSAQKAGYIDGTPADLMNAARENGVFETAGIVEMPSFGEAAQRANEVYLGKGRDMTAVAMDTQIDPEAALKTIGQKVPQPATPVTSPYSTLQQMTGFGASGMAKETIRTADTINAVAQTFDKWNTVAGTAIQRGINRVAGKAFGVEPDLPSYDRKTVLGAFLERSRKDAEQRLQQIEREFGLPNPTDDPRVLLKPEYWAMTVGSGVTKLSNQILLGGGTVKGGAIAGAVQEAMPAFEAMKSEGVNEFEAATRAAAFGGIVAGLEKWGLDKIFKGPENGVIRKILWNAYTESVSEYGEELLEPLATSLGRRGVTITDTGKEILRKAVTGLNVIPQSATMGAFGGGGFSGVNQVSEANVKTKAEMLGVELNRLSPTVTENEAEPLIRKSKEFSESEIAPLKPERKPESGFVKRGVILGEPPKVEMQVQESDVPVEPVGVNTVAKFREQQGQAKSKITPRDMADEMYANQREYGIWDDAGMLKTLKELETSSDPFDRQVYGELVNRIIPDKRLASLQRLNAKKFMEAQGGQEKPAPQPKKSKPANTEPVSQQQATPPQEEIIGQYIHNPAPGKARIAAKMVSPGTATNAPTPEPTNVIAEQIKATADPASTKAATLVTPGEQVPFIPELLKTANTPHGTVIYNPAKVSEAKVIEAGKGDQFDGKLLGMSQSEGKPSDVAVTTSTPEAKDVVAELVPNKPKNLADAIKAQEAAVPGGKAEVKPAAEVAEGRQEKQPWEMTKQEYRSEQVKGQPEYIVRNSANLAMDFDNHRDAVRQALFEGKPVPAAVLVDYPDLAPKAEPAPPPTPKESLTVEKPTRAQQAAGIRKELRRGEKPSSGMVDLGVDMRPPARPPIETKTVKLTSNPKKLNEFVAAIGRQLMAGKRVGGRARGVNTLDFIRQGSMEADRGETADFIKKFKKNFSKIESDMQYLRKDIVDSLEKFLKNDITADKVVNAQNPAVKRAIDDITAARETMDEMSQRIADIMGVEAGNEALQAGIERNKGKYVVRVYKKFAKAGYSPTPKESQEAHDFFMDQLDGIIANADQSITERIEKVKKESNREAVKAFVVSGDNSLIDRLPKYAAKLAKQARSVFLSIKNDFADIPDVEIGADGQIKVKITPEQKEQIVQGQMEYLLKKDTDYGNVFGNTGSAAWKQFQKSFIKRKDIPVELRNFMGEVHDIPAMMQITMTRQRQILTSNHFQHELVNLNDSLPDSEKFYSTIPLPGKTEKIEGIAFGPLTDYGKRAIYADKPTADMLRNLDPSSALENPFFRAWMKGLAVTRFSKTMANWPSYFERNIIANPFFALSGGEPVAHPLEYSKALVKAVKVYASDPKEFYRLMRLSVINSSAHGAELKQTYTEGFGSNTEITPQKAIEYVANYRNRLVGNLVAQAAFGDNVWKMADFYSRVSRGVPEAEAVAQVREVYPYYDEAPDVVTKVLRRAPFVGDFLTFKAETIRTQVNSWLNAAKNSADKDKNWRERIAPIIGIIIAQGFGQALGLHLAASLYSQLKNRTLGGDLKALDRKEEQAARVLLPSYQEDNSILWTKAKNGKVFMTDFGYIQPYDLSSKIGLVLGSGMSAGQKAKKFVGMFASIVEAPMFAQRLAELADNENSKIYSTENPQLALRQITEHLFKKQAPANIVALENMLKIISAKKPLENSQGEIMTVAGELGRAVSPFRVRKFDAKSLLRSRLWELKEAIENAKKPANRAYNRKQAGTGTEEEYQRQAQIADNELKTWATDKLKAYKKAALDCGMKDWEVAMTMMQVNFSKYDIFADKLEYRQPMR